MDVAMSSYHENRNPTETHPLEGFSLSGRFTETSRKSMKASCDSPGPCTGKVCPRETSTTSSTRHCEEAQSSHRVMECQVKIVTFKSSKWTKLLDFQGNQMQVLPQNHSQNLRNVDPHRTNCEKGGGNELIIKH